MIKTVCDDGMRFLLWKYGWISSHDEVVDETCNGSFTVLINKFIEMILNDIILKNCDLLFINWYIHVIFVMNFWAP